MSFDTLSVAAAGPIARVAVDRPERLNALNRATLAELDTAFARLDADPADRKSVV